MPQRDDDISLRDLYLTLRRGLPLIVVMALLAGVAAFVISSMLPATYSSVTVMQVIPSPLGEQQVGGLDFNPSATLSYEAYRSIVLDTEVLQQTLDILADSELTLVKLRQHTDLRRLTGPDNPNQIAPLAVEHIVSGDDPDRVIRIAAAWNQASLDAVRSALTASLTAMAETTLQSLQRRQRAVDESEAAWQAFKARDDRDALGLRLADVNMRLTESSARIDQLRRQITVINTRQTFLGSQLEAATSGTPIDIDSQLTTLLESDLVSLEAVTRLRVLLAEQPELALGMEQDLLVLLMRADYQNITENLVANIAERDFLLGELATLGTQAETLRGQVAELDRTSATLERNLLAAKQALASVAEVSPVIDYARELVATSVSLLSTPTTASTSIGRSRLFNAVAAAALAAIVMVLYTFLREAVRDPEANDRSSALAAAPSRGESQRRKNM